MDGKRVGMAAAVGLGALTGALFVAGRVGTHRWSGQSDAVLRTITRGGARDRAPWIDADGLPAPLQRFAANLPARARPIRTAHLEQVGSIRMGEKESSWKPFRANETLAAAPTGFAWDADIRMLPGLSVRVLDTYALGSGTMKAAVMGLFPVVDMAGSHELSEGALSRYLAESVWMPTRLLQGAGLTWTARDDSTALARLVDGGVQVELLFTFDHAGRVTGVEGIRPREVDGAFVSTRWVGHFGDYREADGYPLPHRGEVAWEIDGTLRPYWRGSIQAAQFDF